MAEIEVWTEKNSKRKQEFSAAAKNITAPEFNPLLSTNPYGETEYRYFQDAWANTRAGEALDILMDFAWGRGVKPSIEILNSKQMTPEQIEKETKSYQWVLDQLMEIDNQDGVQFSQKAKDAAKMAKVFGRCAMVFEYGAKFPDAIKIFHSRYLGLVRVRDHDWSISSVVVIQSITRKETVVADDMIYIVNQDNNPIMKNIGYGFSEMQRPLGAARSMRRFIEYDSPEILTSLWAGYGMFILRPQSKSPTTDLNNLLNGLRAGGFNAITANPEDVKYEQLKLEAETQKLVELMNFFDRIVVSNFKVPSALMGREEDQNMATLFGKIQLFVNGPVMEVRNWIAPYLEKQWYMRNLDRIDKNLKKKIRIKIEFEPLIIESWKDSVEAVSKLKAGIVPHLPDSIALRLLNLSQYEDDLAKAKKEMEEKQLEEQITEKKKEPGKDDAEEDTEMFDAAVKKKRKNKPKAK